MNNLFYQKAVKVNKTQRWMEEVDKLNVKTDGVVTFGKWKNVTRYQIIEITAIYEDKVEYTYTDTKPRTQKTFQQSFLNRFVKIN